MTPTRAVVVEATQFVRRAVKNALEADGIEVVAEVDRSLEAPEVVSIYGPDVVLLDADLDRDMLTVREIVRARPGISVIVLGSDTDARLAVAAVRAGAVGYIPKETDPERLSTIVRGVLDGEAAFPRRLVRVLFAELCRGDALRSALERSGRTLSRREGEVLDLLSEGLPDGRIAERLALSEVTVRRHIASAMRKLGVTKRHQAVALYLTGADGFTLPSPRAA